MSNPTAWMDQAKCAGVRDFTEWPRASRLILCEACPVARECDEWMAEPIENVNHNHRGAPIKQYCKQGHDTFTTGRTKWGHCRECSNERARTRRATAGQRTTGTCPQGHDYATEPTYSNGECRACRRERRQAKEAA